MRLRSSSRLRWQTTTSVTTIARPMASGITLPFPNSPGDASGSMKLTFSENPEGVVKDFRNGDDGKLLLIWRPEGDTIVDFTQVSEARKKQAAADPERREQQERVRSESQRLLESLPEATKDHPYLKSHGITHPVPLRVEGDVLVVPIYKAATGTFQAIQRIWPNGDKKFPAGATKTGGCAMPWSSFELNGLKTHSKDDSPIVICEGFATAAAIKDATRYRTLAALDCGNLKAVAQAIHRRFPLIDIIIAADNKPREDGSADPGIAAANEVAREIGLHCARVAIPPPGDFADLLVAAGEKAVQAAIDAAAEPEPEETEPGLTTIRIVKGTIAAMTDAAELALIAAAEAAPIMVRATMLVQPIIDRLPASRGRSTQVTMSRPLRSQNVIYS